MVLISTCLWQGELANVPAQNAYERSSLLSWTQGQRPGEWI
jgi:hypothetical protein